MRASQADPYFWMVPEVDSEIRSLLLSAAPAFDEVRYVGHADIPHSHAVEYHAHGSG
jgi:hypothetical protein